MAMGTCVKLKKQEVSINKTLNVHVQHTSLLSFKVEATAHNRILACLPPFCYWTSL